MKVLRTDCRLCGALLFTVTYSGTTPPIVKAEDDVGIFFDDRDRCVARCGCGATTAAPQMTAILTHMASHQRTH